MNIAKFFSIAIIGATAIGSTIFPSQAEMLKARMSLNLSPISGVAIIAKDRGIFEKYHLDISVSNFTSGKQALNAVLGGAADIATTAEAPTTAAAMSNQPIAFLARMEYSDLKTLTATSSEIADMQGLKGKKVAFTAGTGSEVYTEALLKAAGLTKDDVTLVNLRPQDMLPALSAGSIDAYNTWEPHISNGKKAMAEKVAEIDTVGVYAETFNIVVMKPYLESNPELVDKFLRALIDAELWMKENPEEAISIIADAVDMNKDDLTAIWDDYIYNVVLDDKQMGVLEAHAAWRLSSGNHPDGATMPDFSTVIVSGPLMAIDPSRVTITGM